jgi:prepilin-type N-terminal cleavage/methylation domain-containing protein
MRTRARGYSFVELLVVLTILLVIAAIAIPNYLSALQRTHEAGAIAFLRQVQTAQETYRIANHEYADTFAKLKPYLATQAALPVFPSQHPSGVLFAFALGYPSPGVAQGQGQGGRPPGQGGTPPGQGGTPPGQGGTPPGQGGIPPGQGGTPPGQGGTIPGQGGTPPTAGGTTPGAGTGGSIPDGASPDDTTSGGTPPGGTTHSDSMVRSLYIYRLSRPSPLQWQCVVEPVRDRTIGKFFYSDDSNVIRYAVGAIPTTSSPQI